MSKMTIAIDVGTEVMVNALMSTEAATAAGWTTVPVPFRITLRGMNFPEAGAPPKLISEKQEEARLHGSPPAGKSSWTAFVTDYTSISNHNGFSIQRDPSTEPSILGNTMAIGTVHCFMKSFGIGIVLILISTRARNREDFGCQDRARWIRRRRRSGSPPTEGNFSNCFAAKVIPHTTLIVLALRLFEIVEITVPTSCYRILPGTTVMQTSVTVTPRRT